MNLPCPTCGELTEVEDFTIPYGHCEHCFAQFGILDDNGEFKLFVLPPEDRP